MAESIPITEYKSLKHLRTSVHQDRRFACSDLRSIYALDTETDKGDIFLIADSDGEILDKITPESCLKFLFSRKFQGSWNFFYYLTYDAEVILKLVVGENLNSYKTTGNLSFEYDNFKLDYIPDKRLTIRKGHHSSVFFDIKQYYVGTLADAYQNNIGPLPIDYLQMKEKRSSFSKRSYRRNPNKVRKYCIDDCIYTKQLAEHWIKLFHEAFSFYPARWISSGYLAEKVLINNQVNIPKFDSIDYSINDLAYRAYFGGRIEIFKRGFIGHANIYDINSAYPYSLSQIPDFTNGEWIQNNKIQSDAKLGFFKILADIPDDEFIPPFPFRSDINLMIFPTGKFVTYCTLDELLACDNCSWYKILDSYQFIPDKLVYPFRDFIETMYQKRMELKQRKDPLQLPIKIILNSMYGKTGQTVRGRIGNLFHPVVFATITGKTRAKLYEFVRKMGIEREVVNMHTDSICTTVDLDNDSDELGEFSFDNSAEDTFVLQNGINRFNGEWKKRGIGKLGSKKIEDMKTYEKNGRLYSKFKIIRAGRLRASIWQNAISDIGKFKVIEREVNLNADRKRFWLGTIKSTDDKTMNESIPLSLNHFTKEQI